MGGVEDLLSDFWTLTPRSFANDRGGAVKSSFFKKKKAKKQKKKCIFPFFGFFFAMQKGHNMPNPAVFSVFLVLSIIVNGLIA